MRAHQCTTTTTTPFYGTRILCSRYTDRVQLTRKRNGVFRGTGDDTTTIPFVIDRYHSRYTARGILNIIVLQCNDDDSFFFLVAVNTEEKPAAAAPVAVKPRARAFVRNKIFKKTRTTPLRAASSRWIICYPALK